MTWKCVAPSIIFAYTLLVLASGVAAAQGGRQGETPSEPGRDLRERVQALATAGRGALPGTDPLVGSVVQNAPYSADAVTTVTQVLGDGTRIEQSVMARLYRDSAGRVRREQTIIGLTAEPQTTITVDPDPGDGVAYMLDASARTARRVSLLGIATFTVGTAGQPLAISGVGAGRMWATEPTPIAPVGSRPTEESLGTRQIEGLKATGRKTTSTIPAGQIGNDRPIEITDERWDSPDLKLTLLSRHHDPRTSDVEYRLMNVSRAEPPADLFMVPSDYTIVGAGGRDGGGRGARGGGVR